jgi:hypothetical protein
MALLNPTPNSFDLTMTSVLGSGSSFHPQLDAFNASIYFPDSLSPFTQFTIPAVKAENGAKSTVQQHITIDNPDAFQAYTSTVLASETVTIVMKGRTGLREGSLPKTTVNYNKTITMAGSRSPFLYPFNPPPFRPSPLTQSAFFPQASTA